MEIRDEGSADRLAIRAVHEAAFGTDAEADLVDTLRIDATPLVSLVAVDDHSVAGHILFSPVTLDTRPELKIMGLAPMAVLPRAQRRGMGSALIRRGLERCRQGGWLAAVVLGHPQYYPRFGFAPASRFGLRSEYDVPDDVFMAIELEPQALAGASGTIRYHAAFASLESR